MTERDVKEDLLKKHELLRKAKNIAITTRSYCNLIFKPLIKDPDICTIARLINKEIANWNALFDIYEIDLDKIKTEEIHYFIDLLKEYYHKINSCRSSILLLYHRELKEVTFLEPVYPPLTTNLLLLTKEKEKLIKG